MEQTYYFFILRDVLKSLATNDLIEGEPEGLQVPRRAAEIQAVINLGRVIGAVVGLVEAAQVIGRGCRGERGEGQSKDGDFHD